jgi:transposase
MRKVDMDKAREVLRLHYEVGLSQREIAQSVKISLGSVSGILSKARAAGLEYPLKIGNKELGSILYPPAEKAGVRKPAEPDLQYIHREMQKKGMTLTLLWEEYKTANPDGLMLTQFCDRYRSFRKQNDVYMRRIYKAGERVQVDWAGLTMKYMDGSGEERPAYIFVAALPASAYLYVEPFRDMEERSWVDGHVHAFEYYGGAPRIVEPDNPKVAITKADYHDPVYNRTYAELARHYGVAIVPARVRKPRDKAHAEKGVQIAERRIISKLRNRQYRDFGELWAEVREELEVVNQAPFKKMPGNRLSVFIETEKPELLPLPPTRYEFAGWKQAKSGMDYHVEYDSHYYSVPYLYAGKQLLVRATSNVIEVFFDHERIVSHVRSYDRRARYVTLPEHMPSRHRAMADWSPERFESWARKYGPDTHGYICFLMQRREHPEQAYKTCAGILRMGESVTKAGMEVICKAAKEKNIFTYKYFNLLFKQMAPNLDQRQPDPIKHENLRGGSYYGGDGNV